MGFLCAAEACCLIVLLFRIDLRRADTDLALHIHKHLTVGRDHTAATANFGVLSERNRCADQVSIRIVAEEAIDDRKRLMRIGTLMRASDDHIDILPCEGGEGFIEIEVIAGHKSEANTLDLNGIRLGIVVAVCNVKLISALLCCFHFTRCGMCFEVTTDNIALSVDRMGRIAPAVFRRICGIDKYDRMTTLCRFDGTRHNIFIIFIDRCMEICLTGLRGGNIAILGKNDQVTAFITFVE